MKGFDQSEIASQSETEVYVSRLIQKVFLNILRYCYSDIWLALGK